jgi:hypothetical protein
VLYKPRLATFKFLNLHEISGFRSGVKASGENIQQPEQIVQACSSTDDAVFD